MTVVVLQWTRRPRLRQTLALSWLNFIIKDINKLELFISFTNYLYYFQRTPLRLLFIHYYSREKATEWPWSLMSMIKVIFYIFSAHWTGWMLVWFRQEKYLQTLLLCAGNLPSAGDLSSIKRNIKSFQIPKFSNVENVVMTLWSL